MPIYGGPERNQARIFAFRPASGLDKCCRQPRRRPLSAPRAPRSGRLRVGVLHAIQADIGHPESDRGRPQAYCQPPQDDDMC